MAADAQRILLTQAPLGRCPKAVGQEVAVVMPEDDVGNDLLEGWIVLHLGSRLEEVFVADRLLMALQVFSHETVPGPVWKHVLALHDENLLGGDTHGTMRTRPRPNTAISSAVRSTSSSRTGRK